MHFHYLGVIAETKSLGQRYILTGLVLIVSPDCRVCAVIKKPHPLFLTRLSRPVLRSVSDVLMRIPLGYFAAKHASVLVFFFFPCWSFV